MELADKAKLVWETSKTEAQLLAQRLAIAQARWQLDVVANVCGKQAIALRAAFSEPTLTIPCQRALTLVQVIESVESAIKAKARELQSLPAVADAPRRAQLASDLRTLKLNRHAEKKRLAEAQGPLGRLILAVQPADGRFAEFYRRRNQAQLEMHQAELKFKELQRRAGELKNSLGFGIRAIWAVGAAVVMLLIAVAIWPGGSASATGGGNQPPTIARRTLVFVVQGTYGNDGFWPNVISGQATFGSELQRALGSGSEIYPFLWDGANDHTSREAAARNLAELIDKKASSFDRICLVGHSHGGNIALRAAGLCGTTIDMVVCLATPHVYLFTRGADGRALGLPVYCSPTSRERIRSLVSICLNGDDIPDTLSNVALGLDQNGAISMTQSWQEQQQFPRLDDDTFFGHNFGSGNVRSGKWLNVANENIEIESFVVGGLFAQHSAIHSRRMGYVVGELLRDGCSRNRLNYVRTLVQPEIESNDKGEPIEYAELYSWLEQRSATFQHVGRRLQQISIHLDSSNSNLYVKVTDDNGGRLWETPHIDHAANATWDTGLILYPDQTDILGVYSGNDSLGTNYLAATPRLPDSFQADLSRGISWSANLQWVPVHY